MTRLASARAFLPILSLATLLGACSDAGTELTVDAAAQPADARAADAAEPTPDAADPTPDAADPLPDAAEPTPDAPPVAHPGCTLWLNDLDTLRPAGATLEATGHDGVLELASTGDGQGSCSSNRQPCAAVKLYKPTMFTGDFDITLDVASVASAATFGGVRLYVNLPFGPLVQVGLLGHDGSAHLLVERRGPGGNTSRTTFTATAAGTLRLHRVGNNLTATATAGTVVLEEQYQWFSDAEVGIALDEGNVATRTAATIASYTALGSAAETDAFDCTADLLH